MPKQKRKPKWQITIESIYVFGREERLEAAYEQIIPAETIQVKSKEVKDARDENRPLRKGIERK
ncbi:MAG TPA: hypothetical protein VE954_19400, partial [Oligoflexus sp.]|uniref:hypothetical protein n=1 Tax=Oligoflexus sp. TaxID=1971216 RepID=UPI002D4CE2A7